MKERRRREGEREREREQNFTTTNVSKLGARQARSQRIISMGVAAAEARRLMLRASAAPTDIPRSVAVPGASGQSQGFVRDSSPTIFTAQ